MIKKTIHFVKHGIWEKKESGERRGGWLIRPFKIALYTVRGIGEHDLFLRAAALTFFTLMSIVPIFALMFGIMKGFGFEKYLVDWVNGQLPQYTELTDYLFQFVDRLLIKTRGGLVAGVGVIVLFWAVARVFMHMENAFNAIWEVHKPRSIPRKFSDYVTVIFLTPILFVVIVSFSATARSYLSWLQAEWLLNLLFRLAGVVLLWLLFAFIYLVMPNTKVRFKGALIAAMLAGTAFYLFTIIYFNVQSGLSAFNAIYGTFAAIPLFLVWLQTSWRIFLVGGELSFAYQNIEHYEFEREAIHMNNDNKRKVLLATMLVIVRRFVGNEGAVGSEDIAAELDLPVRIIRDSVFDLERAGFILAVKSPKGARTNLYIPARDVHSITVFDILDDVERSGSSQMDVRGLPKLSKVSKLLDDIKAKAFDPKNNMKITDLL